MHPDLQDTLQKVPILSLTHLKKEMPSGVIWRKYMYMPACAGMKTMQRTDTRA